MVTSSFFINGITAICNKIEECGNGEFKLYGLNVVNGCQSLNTILSCSENVRKRDDAYVLFRFYEIPQRDRADSISINTNTQSAVKARDLRSNSKQNIKTQKGIQKQNILMDSLQPKEVKLFQPTRTNSTA